MYDLEARVIEYLKANVAIMALCSDVKSEKLPITVVDKSITVKVDPEVSNASLASEISTLTVKVWINTRSPITSQPVKALKDLAGQVVIALNKIGPSLSKSTGGYDLTIYSCRKLGRTDDLSDEELLWSSTIVFEVVKNESEPTY
jgi:hypothetical protein